jgi:hypothetical protein
MAEPKYDGVVEAVHYNPDGRIDWIRLYERRGPVFSDVLLMKRDAVIAHLKAGRIFYAGERVPLLGGTFQVTKPIKILETNGREFLVAGDLNAEKDDLDGVPVI